jgi:hypothetical protein
MCEKLKSLFDKHNCDKAEKHNYHKVYGPEFVKRRDLNINILEIGIFKGASTRSLLEYFPNANFYGIDIFERVPMDSIDIYSNPRVSWIKGDSMSTKVDWGVMFDFIIDDGAHWPDANRLTFLNFIQYLKEDGVYWIEDVFPLDKLRKNISKRDSKWLKERSNLYCLKSHEELLHTLQRYRYIERDHRNLTGHEDSFVYEIRKND